MNSEHSTGWIQGRGRHEYLWDAMMDVEEKQCTRCIHSKLLDPDTAKDHAEEYPMCYEVEGEFMKFDATDKPMPTIHENEDGTVYCIKFEER